VVWKCDIEKMLSFCSVPSQIEQTSVSVYRMERDSDQLSVLFTWTGLNLEQAGGVLRHYVVTINQNGSMVCCNHCLGYSQL